MRYTVAIAIASLLVVGVGANELSHADVSESLGLGHHHLTGHGGDHCADGQGAHHTHMSGHHCTGRADGHHNHTP